MNNLVFDSAVKELLFQIFLLLCAISFCRGKPWSWWTLSFGIAFLIHAFMATVYFDILPSLVGILNKSSTNPITESEMSSIKSSVDLWKIFIPVISLGIGCSMITNFIGAKKD